MSILVDNTQVFNNGARQTVEDTIRVYANWGGIHDFEFENLVEIDTASLTPNNAVPIINNSPSDMTIEYTTSGYGHGVYFAYSGIRGYGIGIDTNGDIYVGTVESPDAGIDGFYEILYKAPTMNAPQSGKVRASFRQANFSSAENDVWFVLSLWINDALIDSYAIYKGYPLGSPHFTAGFMPMGLTDPLTLTDIRVPQLTAFTEWSSIDPGEAPLGGMERAIEGRYIKYYCRWNGALRAWSSRSIAPSHSFSDDEAYTVERNFDKRSLYTHIRMLGAYVQAEYADARLISQYGHRFQEVNNPYLMNAADCRYQAQREVFRMEENSLSETVATQYTPLLEPEDRVSIRGEDWIISSRVWSFAPGTVDQTLTCRKYTPYGA